MKRSKYLVPLSWEHHSALLNANRIQKGLQINAELNLMVEFLKYIWENDLKGHFEREEKIVFSVDDWDAVEPHLKEQVLQEHQAMGEIADKILSSSSQEEIKQLLARFAQMVVDHVRFEERQLFPAVEKSFNKETLQSIEKALHDAHVPGCVSWNPKFWIKK